MFIRGTLIRRPMIISCLYIISAYLSQHSSNIADKLSIVSCHCSVCHTVHGPANNVERNLSKMSLKNGGKIIQIIDQK